MIKNVFRHNTPPNILEDSLEIWDAFNPVYSPTVEILIFPE